VTQSENRVSETDRQRDTLASTTKLGVGATWAGCAYWIFVAVTLAWLGSTRASLGWVLVIGFIGVYPLGYVLNRAAGGDLLAREHPWGGLVRVLWASELVGWPILVVLLIKAPHLVLFGLAASLGAHFIPFAWVYRFWPYAALGVFSVLWASGAQVFLEPRVASFIPIGMGLGYALSAMAAHRAIRKLAQQGI
jgi:hypothetical protein